LFEQLALCQKMDKNFCISEIAKDLKVFPVRKAVFKMLLLLCKQKTRTSKNQLMSKLSTK